MYGAQSAALAFANELIAIGVGVALITWAGNTKKLLLAKVTGYFIAVLAFLALLYTAYCGSASAFTKSSYKRSHAAKNYSHGKSYQHINSHQKNLRAKSSS